jgi:tellurite methyltransferase
VNLTGWEERFRAELAAGAARDRAPAPLLVEIAEGLQPGRALDLACGTGRHALWLAQHGWQVTAVDGSPSAIALLEASAARLGVSIDARVIDLEKADLEKDKFAIEPARWELIASCYYLQRDLIEPIQHGLVPGGVAIVIALLAKSPYRARPGELRACFNGWEILHDREGPDPSGHEVAELAARKR